MSSASALPARSSRTPFGSASPLVVPPQPAVRRAGPVGVVDSVLRAIDDGRLLLALERLEFVAEAADCVRIDAMRATLRVALGHLAHAQLAAPASGVVALAAGRVADAVATPERVDELAARICDGEDWVADELAAVAEASARTDDRRSWHASERAARALLGTATPAARSSLNWILVAAAHRRGDVTGAAAMLAALPGGDPARLPEIAAIAVEAQDAELGRRAREAALRLTRCNAGVPLLSALAHHVTAVLDADVEAQRGSALLLAEARRPLLYGDAAERAGLLGEALAVYERCAATADVASVRRAMVACGVTPVAPNRDWGTLTEAELRVVRLVAAGATNRRAAQALFLSPHTVSSHLRHAFEKLSVTSRVELARIYAQRERVVPSLVS